MYPPQQNSADHTSNFFWLLVIIFLACAGVWYFEKRYVLAVIFGIRHIEIDVIQWIIDGINAILNLFHLPALRDPRLILWQRVMHNPVVSNVTFPEIMQQSNDVGAWLRYPVMVILVSLAGYLFKSHRSARFRKTYSMDTLKKAEVENWPSITPVVSLNLLKQDLDKGPWAMAKLPLDFCRENNLLHIEKKEGKKVWGMDKSQVEKLFVIQMGPMWQGVEKLPIHLKALLVIFISKATRDEQTTEKLLTQISVSAHGGKLNFEGVSELATQYKNHRIIKWLEKRHAYVGTLMASLLEIARTDGVLASSEFLWLKPVDRRMWYMLNSVGRRVSVVEVAGLYAHWRAEQKLQRPLRAPMVEQAVDALEETVNNILYVESESSWHTSNAA